MNACALITGASSGIGLAFAQQLAQEGYFLVLVGRDLSRLRQTAIGLVAAGAAGVEEIAADLSTESGIETVAQYLRAHRVDVVINNAGYGLKTGTLESTPAELAQMATVLATAVQTLSTVAAQRMVARGRGGIINVTSLAAVSTMGVYAAQKAAATIFTEDLACALRGTGVSATAVLPGFVRTEFHSRMGAGPEIPAWTFLSADFVARQALRDARKGKVISVPGIGYKALLGMTKVVPRWIVRGLSSGFGARRQHH